MTTVRPLPLLILLLALGCAPARPGQGPGTVPPEVAPPSRSEAPMAARAVLARFVAGLEAGRWAEAWTLLSARWRAATTPTGLAADFRTAGSAAREQVERVTALLATGTPLSVQGSEAWLVIGAGRRARLVAEPGGWRVDALE
jgi:hypothetical protein